MKSTHFVYLRDYVDEFYAKFEDWDMLEIERYISNFPPIYVNYNEYCLERVAMVGIAGLYLFKGSLSDRHQEDGNFIRSLFGYAFEYSIKHMDDTQTMIFYADFLHKSLEVLGWEFVTSIYTPRKEVNAWLILSTLVTSFVSSRRNGIVFKEYENLGANKLTSFESCIKLIYGLLGHLDRQSYSLDAWASFDYATERGYKKCIEMSKLNTFWGYLVECSRARFYSKRGILLCQFIEEYDMELAKEIAGLVEDLMHHGTDMYNLFEEKQISCGRDAQICIGKYLKCPRRVDGKAIDWDKVVDIYSSIAGLPDEHIESICSVSETYKVYRDMFKAIKPLTYEEYCAENGGEDEWLD